MHIYIQQIYSYKNDTIKNISQREQCFHLYNNNNKNNNNSFCQPSDVCIDRIRNKLDQRAHRRTKGVGSKYMPEKSII